MEILNKCPICNGRLFVCYFGQYEKRYKILNNGKESNNYEKIDCGMTDESYICCENGDFVTDCDWKVTEPNNYNCRITVINDKFYLED